MCEADDSNESLDREDRRNPRFVWDSTGTGVGERGHKNEQPNVVVIINHAVT